MPDEEKAPTPKVSTTFNRESLLKSLELIQPSLSAQTGIINIMDCFCFDAADKKVTAYNGIQVASADVDCGFTCGINGKALVSCLKAFSCDSVEITYDADDSSVSIKDASSKSKKSVALPAMSPKSFLNPQKAPSGNSIVWPDSVVEQMKKAMVFAGTLLSRADKGLHVAFTGGTDDPDAIGFSVTDGSVLSVVEVGSDAVGCKDVFATLSSTKDVTISLNLLGSICRSMSPYLKFDGSTTPIINYYPDDSKSLFVDLPGVSNIWNGLTDIKYLDVNDAISKYGPDLTKTPIGITEEIANSIKGAMSMVKVRTQTSVRDYSKASPTIKLSLEAGSGNSKSLRMEVATPAPHKMQIDESWEVSTDLPDFSATYPLEKVSEFVKTGQQAYYEPESSCLSLVEHDAKTNNRSMVILSQMLSQ